MFPVSSKQKKTRQVGLYSAVPDQANKDQLGKQTQISLKEVEKRIKKGKQAVCRLVPLTSVDELGEDQKIAEIYEEGVALSVEDLKRMLKDQGAYQAFKGEHEAQQKENEQLKKGMKVADLVSQKALEKCREQSEAIKKLETQLSKERDLHAEKREQREEHKEGCSAASPRVASPHSISQKQQDSAAVACTAHNVSLLFTSSQLLSGAKIDPAEFRRYLDQKDQELATKNQELAKKDQELAQRQREFEVTIERKDRKLAQREKEFEEQMRKRGEDFDKQILQKRERHKAKMAKKDKKLREQEIALRAQIKTAQELHILQTLFLGNMFCHYFQEQGLIAEVNALREEGFKFKTVGQIFSFCKEEPENSSIKDAVKAFVQGRGFDFRSILKMDTVIRLERNKKAHLVGAPIHIVEAICSKTGREKEILKQIFEREFPDESFEQLEREWFEVTAEEEEEEQSDSKTHRCTHHCK